MKLQGVFFATAAVLPVLFAMPAHAATVSSIATSIANDTWFDGATQADGTVEIVDLAGEGGSLENDQPLPTGALKLTTGTNNDDRAEAAYVNTTTGLMSVSDFLADGSLRYSYYKQSAGDLNAFAAPAMKLSIFDDNISSNTNDGFAQFIYEPNWNIVKTQTQTVPKDQWITATISGNTGFLWHTGIYGDPNLGGDGSDGFTLSEWNDKFKGDLNDALITGIAIGVGTFNQGQTGFVDNVSLFNGSLEVVSADFETPAPIPLPAAGWMLLAGLGGLGMIGRRKRKSGA